MSRVVTDVSGKHVAPYFLKIEAMLSSESTSKFVPLLDCNALDVWDIYSGLMVQETPRKHNLANLHQEDKARWKDDIENGTKRWELLTGDK